MAGRADIVLCLDASASMQPCFDAVRRHFSSFVDSFGVPGQTPFDCRFDFVAHRAGKTGVFEHSSLYNEDLVTALYRGGQGGRYFTRDAEELRRGLAELRPYGDEAPLVALDCCLDFPWSEDPRTHRVVILLTDEPFEDGVCIEDQLERLDALKAKITRQRVLLFLVGPESKVFDELAAVDRSEYEVVSGQNDGLAAVDLRKVLQAIGRSVSVSRLQAAAAQVERGLYGQAEWRSTSERPTGA